MPCTILKKPQVDAVISEPKSFAKRVLIIAQKVAMPKEVRVMASMICHMAEHRGTRKQPTPPTASLQCMSLRVNKWQVWGILSSIKSGQKTEPARHMLVSNYSYFIS